MKLKLSLLPFIAITMMCLASACSDDSDDTQFRLDTVTDILTTGSSATGLASKPAWNMENTDTQETYSIIFYRDNSLQLNETGSSDIIEAKWQLTAPDAMTVTYTESNDTKTLQVKLTEVVSNLILAECDFGNGLKHFELY